MKNYSACKDSGLPWLGGIAPGWRTLRGKGVFSAVDVRSETGKEELLSVSAADGVVPRSQKTVTMFKAKSYIGHKLCWPGDLVVNSIWAWMQGLGVSRHHGLISSAYSVYRPRQEFTDYGRFFHYLLRSAAYKWELQTRSKGVWLSRLQLLDLAFMDMPILLPPLDEQAAIVRFLDHTNGRIDRFIRAKKKVIALLNEQKQAIIHRAVTRGLAPNVPLKPSGIPWLGEIPEHWKLKRLKSIAKIRYGLGQPPRETEAGLPLIRATNVDSGNIVTKNLLRVDPNDVPKTRNAFLTEGEIIVVRSGAYTADSAIIPKEYEGSVAGYDMVVTIQKARPTFVSLALLSSYVRVDQLIIASMRAAQPHLNAEELGSAVVLLPPDVEQVQIVKAVEEQSAPLQTAISHTECEMALIREYRTRLIADVVTGKLDVREAAKKLPDEAAESGIIDKGEIQTEDEEMEKNMIDEDRV